MVHITIDYNTKFIEILHHSYLIINHNNVKKTRKLLVGTVCIKITTDIKL